MLVSNRTLRRYFLSFNRRYFSGKLPLATTINWVKMVRDKDNIASCHSDPPRIVVSSRLKTMRSVALMILLHEMAHLATDREKPMHGPRWHAEMMRLAKIGAFRKLW